VLFFGMWPVTLGTQKMNGVMKWPLLRTSRF
jgi:hypothetical protein